MFLGGEGIEFEGLDAVNEFLGLAVGGDEVIPAAGDEALGVETEDAAGDGVAVVMVIEEPAIKSSGGDGVLQGVEIHRENDNSDWRGWARGGWCSYGGKVLM